MSLCVRFSMKPFQRLLVAAPAAALLSVVVAPASSLANEVQLNLDSVQGYSIAQATTIRDFSDVYPTDWAYQALSELVETYGCMSGFGDGTFRGQQPVTRFQMAAVLNSCLGSVSAKMDAMGEEMKMGAMEDMDTLERLVASFEEELITLKGSVDGLDAKVSELEDSQFSTTTKASFKIATDFVYFSSEDLKDFGNALVRDYDQLSELTSPTGAQALALALVEPIVDDMRGKEDNSGLAMSSSAEVEFTTSFTGSDKLTFKLKGDVISSSGHYFEPLAGNFYGVADSGNTNVEFTGFTYETPLDLGGMTANLIFGTDYEDFDGIVGLDTYYGGSGYDGYGSDGIFAGFGDSGIGLNVDLVSSDAGTLTASASYAFNADHASNQMGDQGIFGEDTDYSGALALSWDGALFGGNEARLTVMYRGMNHNNLGSVIDDAFPTSQGILIRRVIDIAAALADVNSDDFFGRDVAQNDWKFVAGAYLTDTLSLSGSYAFGSLDYDIPGVGDDNFAQWMIALNLEDAIFPGNSAGIAYGTAAFHKDQDNVTQVFELYYSFNVNDNFEVPIYLDFISNVGGYDSVDAFAIAVRPTLTF